ncbi:MAG: hypothetical protein AAF721_24470 [Myxococcota bacterium]
MATLVEKITAPDAKPKVIEACVQLIDSEVASKRGLSGAAVKAGYKVIKALKPSIIGDAVTNLVPDFATALQPMYEASGAADGGAGAGDKFADHLTKNPDQAADLMLSVTDAKAGRANNKTIKKTYDRLRGSAKKHVVDAVPGLAKTLSKFC